MFDYQTDEIADGTHSGLHDAAPFPSSKVMQWLALKEAYLVFALCSPKPKRLSVAITSTMVVECQEISMRMSGG
jgi:hypothetical protein